MRSAPVRFALVRFALVRFAPLRFALTSLAPVRLAPLRFAPLRFAPLKLQPTRTARGPGSQLVAPAIVGHANVPPAARLTTTPTSSPRNQTDKTWRPAFASPAGGNRTPLGRCGDSPVGPVCADLLQQRGRPFRLRQFDRTALRSRQLDPIRIPIPVRAMLLQPLNRPQIRQRVRRLDGPFDLVAVSVDLDRRDLLEHAAPRQLLHIECRRNIGAALSLPYSR